MAKCYNSHGVEVSAADAKIGGKLRPGFTEMLEDGERIAFDMLFMRDAKSKAGETSIDAGLRERIAIMAKNSNLTVAEYLASTPLAELQKMAGEVAANALEAMSGQGVAAKLADRPTTPAERERIAFDVSVAILNNSNSAKNTIKDRRNGAKPKVLADITAPLSQSEDIAYQAGVHGLNAWRNR